MGSHQAAKTAPDMPFSFLWLELTSKCNLACRHCYAEAGKSPNAGDRLLEDDYLALIREASELGCKSIQFIGGEPTLAPYLPSLLRTAKHANYDYIELFTNGTAINDRLVDVLSECNARVATSFYCDEPSVHDAITRKPNSHSRTVRGIRRLVSAGIELRAGIIEMDENRDRIDQTRAALERMGVTAVGVDRVRKVGRAKDTGSAASAAAGARGSTDGVDDLKELCGHCWKGSLSVTSAGDVSPCVFSRKMQCGNVRTSTLAQILASPALAESRSTIYSHTKESASCDPSCNPYCQPTCSPSCSPTCSPIACDPRGCWPAFGK